MQYPLVVSLKFFSLKNGRTNGAKLKKSLVEKYIGCIFFTAVTLLKFDPLFVKHSFVMNIAKKNTAA